MWWWVQPRPRTALLACLRINMPNFARATDLHSASLPRIIANKAGCGGLSKGERAMSMCCCRYAAVTGTASASPWLPPGLRYLIVYCNKHPSNETHKLSLILYAPAHFLSSTSFLSPGLSEAPSAWNACPVHLTPPPKHTQAF